MSVFFNGQEIGDNLICQYGAWQCLMDESKRVLTVENWMQLDQFNRIKIGKKKLPKKLVLKGKWNTSPEDLQFMLSSPTFNCLSNVEICEESDTMKSIDGIVYSKDGRKLFACPRSKRGKIVLPKGVVSIQREAFKDAKIKEIVFSDSVKRIYENAFSNCENLQSINTNKVAVIGEGAFWSCGSLKDVTFTDSLRQIDQSAFALTHIESVVLPEGVTTIGDLAFENAYLKEVTVPASLQHTGDYAFNSVEKVHIKKYTPRLAFACFGMYTYTYDRKSFLIMDFCKDGKIKEIVIPKFIRYVSIKELNKRLEHYFETGRELDILSLFELASDEDGQIASAIEMLNHYDSAPAREFLGIKAEVISLKCETEDELMRLIDMGFWDERAMRTVLSVAGDREYVVASAYILETIEEKSKEEGKEAKEKKESKLYEI